MRSSDASDAPSRATCAGCSCDCDDLEVWTRHGRIERVSGTCPVGDVWLAERSGVLASPARVDGDEADLDTALGVAARLLAEARMPLVYGLGQAACEAQAQAVAIAETIGGVVDLAGGVLDGASAPAFQTLGASTATLGEIRDRAEIVVLWRADPVVSHPRLLERLRLDAAARAAEPGRTLVVIDGERTAAAAGADMVVPLAPELDLEALWALRALHGGRPVAHGQAPGLPWAALEQLAARLSAARHVAFLYDGGLAAAPAGHVLVLALNALVRELSGDVHAVSAHLRAEGNAAGAEAVLGWQTGYAGAVSFARGFPRANGDEFAAAGLLARGEVDAALVVASDPLQHLPPPAAAALRRIPTVTVDARDTITSDIARVAFATAAVGVHLRATAHRFDGVPVPLRAPVANDRPGIQEVLRRLREQLAGALRERS